LWSMHKGDIQDTSVPPRALSTVYNDGFKQKKLATTIMNEAT